MTRRQNNIIGIVVIILCIAGCIWGILRQKNLKKDHKICIAEPYNYTAGGRGNGGGIWIDYIIKINGEKYEGSSRYLTSDISTSTVENYILGKTFPAVYNPDNPSISSLMILPQDFERFGYIFPDTLNWILPHLVNSK